MIAGTSLKQNFRYLPLYPEIDGWGARVLSAGCVETPPGAIYPAPGHPDDHSFTWETGRRLSAYAFLYITSGEGEYETEHSSGTMTVQEGDAFVVFPGAWHRYRPKQATGWREYWVEASGSLLQTAIARSPITPRQPLVHVGYDRALLGHFNDVIELIDSQPPAFQALVGLQSAMILAMLSSRKQHLLDEGHPGEAFMVRRAILAMAENLDARMDWAALTTTLGASYTSFRRTFRRVTGRSPGDYFTEMKINRARQLLSSTSRSIQEIANSLGFDTSSHFSHLFKARTRMSPRAFRNSTMKDE